jgi:transcriptional regulator with XRE-family HTH domain
MRKRTTSLDELVSVLEGDPEFVQADRRLKPYYDLVLAIVRRRNELGLTQKDLAVRAGTHQSRISKIESAEHDIRLSTLIQIANALNAEVSIQLIPAGSDEAIAIPHPASWRGRKARVDHR